MATIRSSKAITRTKTVDRAERSLIARLSTCAAILLVTLATPGVRPAPSASAPIAAPLPAEAMTTSFFDPFDRLEEKRWYVSDGWVNGPIQGCTWSRRAIEVKNGELQLKLIKSPSGLRPYICGDVHTHAKLSYGWYEARMRTAAGSGLNSAIFTYSGPPNSKSHDEIDFEFLGKAPGSVQLNYYVNAKGGHETFPALGFDASKSFNVYAIEWTPGRIRWFINGKLVRMASDATMPSTAGPFFLDLWNGTSAVDAWLGKFEPTATPSAASVDWAAYTRMGERCRFPESTSCKF